MTIHYDVLVAAPYDREEEANEVVRQLRDLGLRVCDTRGRALNPHAWQENVRAWSRQSLLRVALAPPEGHDRPLHSRDGWRHEDMAVYMAFASRAHVVFYPGTGDNGWILGCLLGFLEQECRMFGYTY